MANYVEDRNNSITKVKASIKKDVMDYIIECLVSKYGEDNCSYVRNGNGQSKTKEFAVRCGTVDANGEEYEAVVCINASAKDYREHTSDKGKVYSPYEFNVMREEFEIYLEERKTKEADSKSKKEKKIAKDSAARAKKNSSDEDGSGLMDF